MPQRERLHSNWGYFAVVYTGMALAMGAASLLLDVLFQVTGAQIGLTIGGFIAAAILAGLRYVRAHGNVWTGRERHHLALAYAFTSFVVSAVVMSGVSLAIFVIEGQIDELLTPLGHPDFYIFLGISLAVGLLIYYLLARFALFVVDRAAHAGAGQPQ
ncbi:MAG: ABZJ_00895 family protein [Caulobacteraceae bacterium]|nr:ABZJ_00895 family protein [Caulobacteraceae bacterium]